MRILDVVDRVGGITHEVDDCLLEEVGITLLTVRGRRRGQVQGVNTSSELSFPDVYRLH